MTSDSLSLDQIPAAAPAPPKKVSFIQAALIVIVVSLILLFGVTNLDIAGQACLNDGSTVPAICCFEAMTSVEMLVGNKSIRLANALSELSLAYSHVPRMSDAMRAQLLAIKMRSDLMGADDSSVLIAQAILASYKTKAKDYQGAQKLLDGLIAKVDSMKSPDDFVVAYILNTMVRNYMDQAKYSEAETTTMRLMIMDDVLVAERRHPFYAKEKLAQIYCKTGRLNAAEDMARSALAYGQAADATMLAVAHEALAKVLIVKGDTAGAQQEFQEALRMLSTIYGEGEQTQYTRARYAHLLQQKDPFAE